MKNEGGEGLKYGSKRARLSRIGIIYEKVAVDAGQTSRATRAVKNGARPAAGWAVIVIGVWSGETRS